MRSSARRAVVAALLLVACAPGAIIVVGPGGPSPEHLERARAVLRSTPLIDGHNDLPWAIRENRAAPHDVEAYDLRKRTPGHTDFERLSTGMLGGQFWSVYIPGDTSVKRIGYAKAQLEQIDIAKRVIAKYPERLEAVTSAEGFRSAFAAGRIGSAVGMEGGHAIENSLGAL